MICVLCRFVPIENGAVSEILISPWNMCRLKKGYGASTPIDCYSNPLPSIIHYQYKLRCRYKETIATAQKTLGPFYPRADTLFEGLNSPAGAPKVVIVCDEPYMSGEGTGKALALPFCDPLT